MGSRRAIDKAPSAAAHETAVPASTPGPALCGYARAELEAASAALADPDFHEGVHQARKAIRRARAVLGLGDGLLGPGAGLIDRELRALNRGLSTLRDAQALVEVLDRLLARERDGDRQALLARAREAAVADRAQITQAGLRSDPGLGARRALLAVLHAALPALDWNAPTPAGLRMAVADTDLRTQQARLRACASDEDEDWHRWRRRARRASHERRALQVAGVTTAATSEAFDKRTAEHLGRAQDLTLLLAHCGRESPFSKHDRQALRARAEPALRRARRRIARRVAERSDACPAD